MRSPCPPCARVACDRVSHVPVTRTEAGYLAATLFAVTFITVLGLVMAILGAMHGVYEGRRVLLGAFVGLALVAAGLEVARL